MADKSKSGSTKPSSERLDPERAERFGARPGDVTIERRPSSGAKATKATGGSKGGKSRV